MYGVFLGRFAGWLEALPEQDADKGAECIKQRLELLARDREITEDEWAYERVHTTLMQWFRPQDSR